MKGIRSLLSVAAVAVLSICAAAWATTPNEPAAPKLEEPVRTRRQIEADWPRQDAVRGQQAEGSRQQAEAITPEEDAAGACDGVKNGLWGFHTGLDDKPWWQIDLENVTPLDQIHIYNRCDGAQDRAFRLMVLLSDDGSTFRQVYQHDGAPFFGHSDGKPLAVNLDGKKARYVRIQLPGKTYLHLDEVEVYCKKSNRDFALRKRATQSSTSEWSSRAKPVVLPPDRLNTAEVIRRGMLLAENLRGLGARIDAEVHTLDEVARREKQIPDEQGEQLKRELYFRARWAVRRIALKNPLLDFDDLLLVKRVPGTFTHMSDQYYGWFSRPGGGLYVLEGFKTDTPELRCLSSGLPSGSIIRPDVSYDAKRVLFAHCKHYTGLKDEPNKLDKSNLPEDAFYHLYEMNLDGTGLRRLTRGKYDDFDGRYLPDGRIVFLSTRRGQHVQCGRPSGAESIDGARPDSYVRCGGGPERPVAIYTLHVMDAEGGNLTQVSPFENFEWTPSIDSYGRILYARWDYVDRHAMPFMSLWSTMPDGTGARAVFGNFTRNPHCIFEARSIPGSQKLIFTASGHHAMTGGCLVLLDPNKGDEGPRPMTRLTPEVVFPESEGWPSTYFVNPYPLAEEHYLVAWSASPLPPGTPRPDWGMPGPANDLGVYLFDTFGNLNLLYRDPEISSMYPLPIRPRRRPPQIPSQVNWDGDQEGRMLLIDVYQGLGTIPRGTIDRLRIVGVPAKDHPTMNYPVMGLTRDDPGKFVMGTVPVDEDGSAFFRVPSGVPFFMQALDGQGMAVQTMRSAAYVQPGQTYTCVGCHEQRNTSPPNVLPSAARREPSKITPGPEGSWPLDFQVLVQPVMEEHCTVCHKPGAEAAEFDLSAEKSYDSLVNYGDPSLKTHVIARRDQGRSTAGACASTVSPLVKLLRRPHHDVNLAPDDWTRLITWIDTYAQRLGSFSKDLEERLRELRRRMSPMLAK